MSQVSPAPSPAPGGPATGVGMRAAQTALILLGAAGLVWGGWVMVHSVRIDRLPGVALWIGAGIVVHDAVIAPVVFFAGVLLRRAGRPLTGTIVALVQGTIVLGSIVTLIVVPEIIAQGIGPRNPTVLPLNYSLNLAVFWVMIAVVATSISAVLYARSRRANQRPSNRQS
jgi:hypothetical protein